MRKSRLFVLSVGVGLLAIMGVLLPSSASAAGSRVTINLTAVVDLVDNPFGIDLGGIAPGDVITGSYTYNPKTTDTNDFVLVGDYQQDKKKYGMQLDMGSFSTQTVDFGLEIVNDYNGLDNYLVGSYNIVSTGPRVEHVSWQLDDPTQTAVSSDALPTTAPVLSSWEGNRLVVDGGNWFISAHVTEAVKVA